MSGRVAARATGIRRKSDEHLLVVGLVTRCERGDEIAEAAGASDAIYICPPGDGLGPGPATGLRIGMYNYGIVRSWNVLGSLRANCEAIRPPPATRMKQGRRRTYPSTSRRAVTNGAKEPPGLRSWSCSACPRQRRDSAIDESSGRSCPVLCR
jgi:hypothetical protein